jgi:hypothetical protein
LLTIELDDMLKNVVLHSVATALANRVLPATDYICSDDNKGTIYIAAAYCFGGK